MRSHFSNRLTNYTFYQRATGERKWAGTAITKFNIDQFAYMVDKMHSLKEGDGTLLDNCIMMWGSGLEDGDRHTRKKTALHPGWTRRWFDQHGTLLTRRSA